MKLLPILMMILTISSFLYFKKLSFKKELHAYHNNDSYGQGMDYKKSKFYDNISKLSLVIGFVLSIILIFNTK